jgi:hypothetical protein
MSCVRRRNTSGGAFGLRATARRTSLSAFPASAASTSAGASTFSATVRRTIQFESSACRRKSFAPISLISFLP